MKNLFSILLLCLLSICATEKNRPGEDLGIDVQQIDQKLSEEGFKEFLATDAGQNFLDDQIEVRNGNGDKVISDCDCSKLC